MDLKTKVALWFAQGAFEGGLRTWVIKFFISKQLKKEGVQKMFEKWREALAGKKTYIVGAAGILGAIAGWVSGSLTSDAAIKLIWEAILGMTIRAGVAKA